jgi:hypothetical protein
MQVNTNHAEAMLEHEQTISLAHAQKEAENERLRLRCLYRNRRFGIGDFFVGHVS